MRTLLSVAACLVACSAGLFADELSPAEQELVALMTDYYAALDPYWSGLREFDTPEAYKKAIDDGTLVDPNAEYIPRLLDFETAHRGDDVGLLSLLRVFIEAARGYEDDEPATVGRREAAGRLSAYVHSDLLSLVVKKALGGNYDPVVYGALQSLVDSGATPPSMHDTIRFFLAMEDLGIRDARVAYDKRIQSLRSGAEPRWPGELDRCVAWVEKAPTLEATQLRAEAAVQTLAQLANSESSPVLPEYEGLDERWYVVRAIDDPEPRRLSDQASALLFKERNLKIGAKAPDLEVTLLDGKPWRMADQHGKVVVVQFSFTGCGPCAQMYPDLADLTAEHGDRLEILTLMRDETPESALESVAEGKLTWSVAPDGKPGRVARQWSVDGFPTVYVIDPEGKIAAVNLRGQQLRDEVKRLLDAE